jgi:hypothetical protein
MHRFRFLSFLIVTAAVLLPVSTRAAVGPQGTKATVQVRVYDRSHKDYHVWDDQEDQTYRKYLSDNHQTYRPIAKLNSKQQSTYWNFRHTDDRK